VWNHHNNGFYSCSFHVTVSHNSRIRTLMPPRNTSCHCVHTGESGGCAVDAFTASSGVFGVCGALNGAGDENAEGIGVFTGVRGGSARFLGDAARSSLRGDCTGVECADAVLGGGPAGVARPDDAPCTAVVSAALLGEPGIRAMAVARALNRMTSPEFQYRSSCVSLQARMAHQTLVTHTLPQKRSPHTSFS
jgi:hypothetical protein